MRGFEQLAKLDPIEVSQRTYISVDEFKAIVDKRFDMFGRTKATGFMKILQREYDLDLSDWMDEYEAYKKDNDDEKDIFVLAPKESDSTVESKLYVYVALGIIAFFILLFFLFPSGNDQKNNAVLENNNYIVDEAQQKLDDTNGSLKSEVIALPEKEVVVEEKIIPPVKKDVFYLSASTDLWVGIKYLDTNEATDKIFKNRLDLDPTRPQRLTMGHGFFKLVFNDRVIEPRVPNIYKITYQKGELDVVQVPIKEPENVQTETQKEKTDDEILNAKSILAPIEE